MIPKIIHRVHLGPVNYEAERFWNLSKFHNKDWKHITHRDVSIELWPMLGKFLKMSPSFAYKSDLMRFEILYKFGGIYIDTDIEVLKPFDQFSELSVPFAAWENKNTIGSAVIGSPVKNEEVLKLINYCIESINQESVNNEIKYSGDLKMFSPNVVTKFWSNNNNVVVFPEEYFYPYHWSEKYRKKENFSSNKNTFAVHHWNGSWITHDTSSF